MSSVQSKDQSLKKVPLYRKMSLDHIRCSAAPLLGSIFKKDSSIIHLLVNAMNSSRAVMHKPVTVPAIRFLCVAMAILVYLIRKMNGGVSFKKLDNFLAEINQLKSKQQSNSIKISIKARISKILEQQTLSEIEKNKISVEPSIDIKETPCDNKRLLRFASLSGIAFVYIQFCFLIFLTMQSQLKIGFMFLLACAFYVNYLYLKISLTTNSHEPKRRVSRRETMTNKDMKSTKCSGPTVSFPKYLITITSDDKKLC